MAGQVFLSTLYMLPRTSCWVALFALALLDGLQHRHENARARKLYAGVVVVLGAFVVQDVLLLLYALTGGSSGAIFSVYIFFTDLADSMFTALLLTIAAGFCITREDLGPYKLKVTIIPAVYFVTILIVDYIMDAVRGRAAFNVADFDSPEQSVGLELSEWQRTLLVICAFVNLLALIAAWVYVFDTIQKEREMLEQPEQDVYGETGAAGSQAGQQSDVERQQAAEAGAGHTVLPPIDAGPQDTNIPNVYGNVTAGAKPFRTISPTLQNFQVLQPDNAPYFNVAVEDLDGPKTVEEKVARLAKIRLLKQFSAGVITYVLATALVVLLPIFVSPEASTGEQAVRVVLILQNVVLWVFMAGLAWIFRLRGDSPYLMVGEEGQGSEDGGGDDHLRTELGVLGEEDEGANVRRHGGSLHGSMDNFALHDIEDDEDPAALAEAGRAQQAAVQSEAPKAPMLKGVLKSDEMD